MKDLTIMILSLAGILLCAAFAVADVPYLINYQGIVTDTDGNPITGSHDLTFSIYADSLPSRPPLWTEVQTGVTIDNGLFNVTLGFKTPIPAAVFNYENRFMGITVDTDDEMSPRMRIASVPWSMRAAIADSAVTTGSGGAGDGHSLDAADGDPTDAVYVDNEGNVGIGTMDPREKLNVVGNIEFTQIAGIGGSELVLRTEVYNEPGRYRLKFANNNVAPITGDDNSDQYFDFASNWAFSRNHDAHLRIHGKATENWGKFLELTHDGIDGKINTDTGHILFSPAGNIGISETNPTEKLVIGNNGNLLFKAIDEDAGDIIFQTGTGIQKARIWSRTAAGVTGLLLSSGDNTADLIIDENGDTNVRIIHITGGSDLSEQFIIRSTSSVMEPTPGMVVSIDSENPGELVVSNTSYDRKVAGIISGAGGIKPGMLMGQEGSEANGNNPVALTGRVYCLADASTGFIEPGDLLTTSEVPGHAMKVTDYNKAQGAILGKAMSSLNEGRGLVLVLVTLQ